MCATYSLLPIVEAFGKEAGISVELRDISLAGRIVASFSENLTDDQKIEDHLTHVGNQCAEDPTCNLIKLPNISAALPQLCAAIQELQSKGYHLPDYPEDPKDDAEEQIKARYTTVLGSAVNPVIREGNSDRRAAGAVKMYGQKHPHKMMKPWPEDSRCRVAHMSEGDYFDSEKSITMPKDDQLKIEFVGGDGSVKMLKGFAVKEGEVVDSTTMNAAKLRVFIKVTVAEAKEKDCLLSLHLKATLMKTSDPIVFGHAVSIYFEEVFTKYASTFEALGVSPNFGLSSVLSKLKTLPSEEAQEIEEAFYACYKTQPGLAMVDSSKGITNFHNSNKVIVDASMATVIRDGGRMYDANNSLKDTIAMIPDRCYATIYQAMIEDCQKNGQLDPATMGSMSNVGLMAQQAEEYGSHARTFHMEAAGSVRIVDTDGRELLTQPVEKGDIFRCSTTRDCAVKDWVKLAVKRARVSGQPTVFWLDDARAHDREIMAKVALYLPEHDIDGLDIQTMAPLEAQIHSLAAVRAGKNVISVTGNVLRDYLTDLYPILELGTSARMLSIVPLFSGGGLFETGAGGSAPLHMEQFLKENHLRWDSLGEYCALVPSLELAAMQGNAKAAMLAEGLDTAIMKFLENQKTPSRKVGEMDNRCSSFWLALYWAEALAQSKDVGLKLKFFELHQKLLANADKIERDFLQCQGAPVDIGGYYWPDRTKLREAMCPSATFNAILAEMSTSS